MDEKSNIHENLNPTKITNYMLLTKLMPVLQVVLLECQDSAH